MRTASRCRRGIDWAAALEKVEAVRSQCRLHPFGTDVLDQATALLGAYPHLGARDAVHAATAVCSGVGRLLSTDRSFDTVTEVARVDPAAEGAPWLAG